MNSRTQRLRDLVWVASRQSELLTEELKRIGVDACDEAGNTALIMATVMHDIKAIKALVAHGANPDTRNHHGWSARAFAQRLGDASIISALKHHGHPCIKHPSCHLLISGRLMVVDNECHHNAVPATLSHQLGIATTQFEDQDDAIEALVEHAEEHNDVSGLIVEAFMFTRRGRFLTGCEFVHGLREREIHAPVLFCESVIGKSRIADLRRLGFFCKKPLHQLIEAHSNDPTVHNEFNAFIDKVAEYEAGRRNLMAAPT